jgi:uncharacterized membrane protein YfcA
MTTNQPVLLYRTDRVGLFRDFTHSDARGEDILDAVAEALLLSAAGLVAGIVNTLAGGGSLLTVPLLVLLGLPGTVANGTNRVGILVQNGIAVWRFRAEGVSGLREAAPILPPVLVGAVLGAFAISNLSDAVFERIFAIAMLLLLGPILRRSPRREADDPKREWSRPLQWIVFLGIGLYGGALQAGVGIPLVLALSHTGYDLVRANSIKVVVIASLTAASVPIFIWQGQVAWVPALYLTLGFGLGGAVGTRLAVRGGERVIRPVFLVAVGALAARLLGVF